MNIRNLFKSETTRHRVLADSYIMTNPTLCVQCGICSFNCPLNIDIRHHAWQGKPVKDSRCLTCGECIARCPRGGLHFEQTRLFSSGSAAQDN
jgi:ferredoxin